MSLASNQHQNFPKIQDSPIKNDGWEPYLFEDFNVAYHSLSKKRKERAKQAAPQGRSIMPEINRSLLMDNSVSMIQKDNEIRLVDMQDGNISGKL